MSSQCSDQNRFQFAKSSAVDDIVLLNASMTDFTYGKHAHEEFSIGVTLRGRQDFFAVGQFHKSHPGSVIILNPDDAHDGESGGDKALEYKMLYVKPEQLTPALSALGMPHPEHFRVKHTVSQQDTLRDQVLRLASLIESDGTTSSEYESGLFELAEQLVPMQEQSVLQPASRMHRLLNNAKEYLQDNYTKEVALDELCQVACLSKFHFLRSFKDYTGMTPHQYWLNIRINRARQALKSGIPVSNVANIFGFNDLSHFNRRFKPVFGMTPYQYQRLILSP
ncbi:helix-turn-helix domain-containing protein [Marinomonas mediterranea]|uniref:AraC family transcriptional regulator n=1 Tax=Marinomonas mediterranea TaxID=119864 RepID=UPI00234B5961|nr:AraC family transcriptional regulator [Marinomonas mediterranea]WCN15075.1 helix-turn-helix domain-containing protein [Marinomonas mediterranea]